MHYLSMEKKRVIKAPRKYKVKVELQTSFQLVLFRSGTLSSSDTDGNRLQEDTYVDYRARDLEEDKNETRKQVFDLKGETSKMSISQLVTEVIKELWVDREEKHNLCLMQFKLAELSLSKNSNSN